MFKSYFKSALRNIRSNKLFTVLNVAGLAIGLCVFMVLFAYVINELSFDRMYKKSSRIFRVNMQTTAEFNYGKWAELPNAVGPAMLQEVPQVQAVTRLIKSDFGEPASLKAEEKTFTETGLYLADKAVFGMFDFDFTEGSVHTAFAQPKSVVLSASAKERLFGKQPALGKTIQVNSADTLYVSGVYKNLPVNSTIDCDMIANIMDTWMKEESWSNASFETYCLLKPGADAGTTEKLATGLVNKYVEKDAQYYTRFFLQPLTAIHLYSADLRPGYSSRMGNIATVKGLLALSVLILLIACINYMNLATARLQKRTKGIGINKVLGASKRQMLLHFYTETGVVAFVSVLSGYALSFLAFPLFRNITGDDFDASHLSTLPVITSLALVWILVTLLAGSYPAFSMAHISPLALLNKSKQKYSFSNLIRKGLVVFQFAASIALIVAVVVIYQQLQFIGNKNLGYNPTGVVALSVKPTRNSEELSAMLNAMKGLAGVESVSAVQSIPGERESGKTVRKAATDKESMPVKTSHTDGFITEAMQLKLLAGTSLPVTLPKGDTICYTLINEVVAAYLGYKTPQEAVGKYMASEMADKSMITGVMKNFHYSSLKEAIDGYVFYQMNQAPEPYRMLLVRYRTQNLPALLGQLQGVFKMSLPNLAFHFEFLDQHVQKLYAAEQKTAGIVSVFSLLAIFIACLGLFGLVAFTAERRTKEIGIRKVLGADVFSIVGLLSVDFLKLVGLAALVAFPVAWYVMQQWLNDFAYRIGISWWLFLLAAVVAAAVAFVTISFQAIRAAVANPIKSLRTE